MNIDLQLERLKRIAKVDAPPFLLTRIKEQIRQKGLHEAPVQWRWAFAATAVLTLALNISILLSSMGTKNTTEKTASNNNGIENVVNSMNLSSNNNLYNE